MGRWAGGLDRPGLGPVTVTLTRPNLKVFRLGPAVVTVTVVPSRSRWRPGRGQAGESVPNPASHSVSRHSEFRLRRNHDGPSAGRDLAAETDSRPADSGTSDAQDADADSESRLGPDAPASAAPGPPADSVTRTPESERPARAGHAAAPAVRLPSR